MCSHLHKEEQINLVPSVFFYMCNHCLYVRSACIWSAKAVSTLGDHARMEAKRKGNQVLILGSPKAHIVNTIQLIV
jgi:hypothetical protein